MHLTEHGYILDSMGHKKKRNNKGFHMEFNRYVFIESEDHDGKSVMMNLKFSQSVISKTLLNCIFAKS